MKLFAKSIIVLIIIISMGIFRSPYVYSESKNCNGCLQNILKLLVTEVDKNEQFIDITGGNIKNNIDKLKSLTKDNFVLIDNNTLSNKKMLKELKSSKATFCMKSFSQDTQRIREIINQELGKNIEIINVIPTDENEIMNVFGGIKKLKPEDRMRVLNNSAKQMNKAKKLFNELKNVDTINKPKDGLTVAQIIETNYLKSKIKIC